MYPADYNPDGSECSCGQSSPLCGNCRPRYETRETMAAEDYFPDEYAYDDFQEEEPREGWDAYYARQVRELRLDRRYPQSTRRVQVVIPGSLPLEELGPGETFRFASAVNPANVYMVIDSIDLDDQDVHYVLLRTGKVYSSRPTKRVMQVDVSVVVDDKRGRGRV